MDHRTTFTEEDRQKAIDVYLEGNGFRATARILTATLGKEFKHRTIITWVKKAGEKLENESVLPQDTIPVLEMDELYTYVKKK